MREPARDRLKGAPKGDAPEALLAGNDDLSVLGDFCLDFTEELLVGNHVAATQPPAAQPKVGCLLQEVDDAPLCLGNVDRDFNGALHCGLCTSIDACERCPLGGVHVSRSRLKTDILESASARALL